MARPENEFPTIEDAHEALQSLMVRGFGKLPVQMVLVPASTLFALAASAGHSGPEPARMIEMQAGDKSRMGVLIASADTLGSITAAH